VDSLARRYFDAVEQLLEISTDLGFLPIVWNASQPPVDGEAVLLFVLRPAEAQATGCPPRFHRPLGRLLLELGGSVGVDSLGNSEVVNGAFDRTS
jgi:hypothetical protein